MEEKQMIQFFASKQDLVELEAKMDEKMSKRHNETLTHFDEQLVILRRLDQERIFTTEHIRRIEERVKAVELAVA